MSLNVGRARLQQALKQLGLRWEKVKLEWNDSKSRELEEQDLLPLEPIIRGAVAAMDHMNEMLIRARRDCE